MQRFIFTLLLAVSIFSCSQDPLNNQSTPSISFDLDGQHYEYSGEPTLANGSTGAWSTKLLGTSVLPTIYGISGNKDQANNIVIQIVTKQDTLKPMSYRIDNTGGSLYIGIRSNNIIYSILDPTDFADLKITGYQSGVINGTFSGKFSKIINVTTSQPASLTNGEIKNVKIRY